ncbi:MAG: helix-turn-helix domain-containing protein [Mycobacterium sp.]
MGHAKVGDAKPEEPFRQAGIDLSGLPAVMTTQQLAQVLDITPAALAQDRYRGGGIPFVKVGRRVRYMRGDVATYLVAHRIGGDDAA